MIFSELIKNWQAFVVRTKEFIAYLRNGRSPKQVVTDTIRDVKAIYFDIRAKLANLEKTNFDLAMNYYNAGETKDAIFRFKLVKKFYPHRVEVNYYIARCLIEINAYEKAQVYIEEYLKSGDTALREEAKYTYDLILSRLENIKNIPESILKHTFDMLAPSYDKIFIIGEGSPYVDFYNKINQYLNSIGAPFGNRILDLGCGTGFLSQALRVNKVASFISGVDVSRSMITAVTNLKAMGLPTFDEVHNAKIEDFLGNVSDKKYNIILLSKVLDYIKDPKVILQQCKPWMAEKGLVAIMCKTLDNSSENVVFDPYFEEFHFKSTYLVEILKELGLNINYTQEIKFLDGDAGIIILASN